MIEWFLQPKNDTERSISHAMKLYSVNTVTDDLLERYLERDDNRADRKFKEIQTRKLAREEGLDYESYMNDDSAEENRTLKGAVAYGARPGHQATVSAVMRKGPALAHDAQWISDLDRGPAAMARNVSELMRKFEAGTVGKKFPKSIAKYASFL